MQATDESKLKDFKKILFEIEYLKYTINSLLYWDRITYMPKKASEYRGEVITYFGEKLYKLLSSEELNFYVNLYSKRKNDKLLDATIRRIHQAQKPVSNVPEDEYTEYVRLLVITEQVWEKARSNNSFSMVCEYYEKVFSFFRKFTGYWGYENEPYDALINLYVEGYTTNNIDSMAEELKGPLIEILREKLANDKGKKSEMLIKNIHKEKQVELWKLLLEEIGFDFDRGRVDVGAYTTILSNSPDDVRIVNEYSEDDIFVGIFNVLHSGGKAVYQQKISKDLLGTLLAESPSYVMEEAIGRFYENIIGRSKGFWDRVYPKAVEIIPQLKEVNIQDFYEAINNCTPSSVRMNADEITFLIHIIIRYEIEKGLIRGRYKISELEEIWKVKYMEYLRIHPENVREGVLQDVHWASGYVGYFPTYILACITSAQIAFTIEKNYDSLNNLIAKGGMEEINEWMQRNIFQWGAIYDFQELVKNACKEELNASYYLEYLRQKFL